MITKGNCSFWISLPLGAAITGIVGFIIGIPALKTRGPYFVIVTLGFNVIITEIIENWEKMTGGILGISEIAKPSPIMSISFDTKTAQYFLILSIFILSLFMVYRLRNSTLGKNFVAIKENEALAECLGIPTMQKKILAFTLSSTLAGLAGGLFASYIGIVVPHDSSFHLGFNALVYLSLGGVGTLPGTIIGPLIIGNIPEILREYGDVTALVNGTILLLIIIFMPRGIFGKIDEYLQKLSSD